MKNNPLDDIIKCDVEISSPGSSDVSFDSILLVVAGPAAKGTATISGTTAISKADTEHRACMCLSRQITSRRISSSHHAKRF